MINPLQREIALEQVLCAFVVLTRPVRARPERRADILEVMTNETASVRRDQRVERVAGLHVHEVRPGAKHLQRAELAPMFVRNDVIRIVRARAVVAEPSERAARYRPCCNGAVAAVGGTVGAAQHVLDVAQTHLAAFAGRRRHRRGISNRELIGTNRNQVVLHLPIAQRPEDLVGDQNRARCRFGMSLPVE